MGKIKKDKRSVLGGGNNDSLSTDYMARRRFAGLQGDKRIAEHSRERRGTPTPLALARDV